MKTVSILTENSRIPNFFTHPIRKNLRRLKALGYSVRLFRNEKGNSLDSDILGLMSSRFSAWWHHPDTVFEFIEAARRHTDKIIWLDDNDSTGVTHFELLPHVDLYLKKQLLKDKTLYARPLYGDRLFTDYYHRHFGVVDRTPIQSQALDLSLSHKVHLSWHIGLGDMGGDILPQKLNRLRYYLPPRYPDRFTSPSAEKPLDLMFRGTRRYDRSTVSFHRETIGTMLNTANNLRCALEGRVSIKTYIRECREAKIMVSPFGWGEIGVRDFEAWIYGSALMKPDMSHMVTWPDVFSAGRTYVPIAWDFHNLISGIEVLLDNAQMRLEIAFNGQHAYQSMISDEGMLAFCNWFVKQIEQ